MTALAVHDAPPPGPVPPGSVPGLAADPAEAADTAVPGDTAAPLAVPEPGSAQERIVDATLRCIARWGLAKTTLDDVAREAGLGRATLYRMVPGGRDGLLDAVVTAETGRFFARLRARLADAESLEDVLVNVIVEAATTLAGHDALQFLFAHEPEAILPHLAFQRMDALLGQIASLTGPSLQPWMPGRRDAEGSARAAEWMTRIVLSYVIAPSPGIDVRDPESVHHLVRTYVLPGLAPA